MCLLLFRPFYGWWRYYFIQIIGRILRHLSNHIFFLHLILNILLVVVNIAIDVVVTYDYASGRMLKLSDPDAAISLLLIVFTGAGIGCSILVIWGAGNVLNNFVDNKSGERLLPSNKVGNKSQVFSISNKPTTSTGNPPKKKKLEFHKVLLFQAFQTMFIAIVSPVYLYLLYYYVLDCVLINNPVIFTKVILAGLILPLSTSYFSLKSMHGVISSLKYRSVVKPFSALCTMLTLAGVAYGIWMGGYCCHRIILGNSFAPPRCNNHGVRRFENDFQSLITLKTSSGRMNELHLSKLLRGEPETLYHNCGLLEGRGADLSGCKEVVVTYTYNPGVNRVVYSFEIQYRNDSVVRVGRGFYRKGEVGFSCGLCKLNNPVSVVDIGPILNGSQKGESSIPGDPCVVLPQWLTITVIGITGLVFIIYLATLMKALYAMRSKTKKEEQKRNRGLNKSTRIVVDENGQERVIRLRKPKVVKVASRRR